MLRFALNSLSALAVFAGAMGLSHARADNGGPSIAGEWGGKYVCAQGLTALRLSVVQGEGQTIAATFSFGPLPENPEVPKGAYRMAGAYDPATRRVRLAGVEWIDAPVGYVMVGLDGRMTQSGDAISGDVPDLFGCAGFEVHRLAQLIG